jgi:hypothetical protein
MAPAEASGSLVSSKTLAQAFFADDTLFLDALITGQTGPLMHSVAFTVGDGVTGFTGSAAWETTTAAGSGPRLLGVNIDIFDSTNTSIFSDTFLGTSGAFAISSLGGMIGPGNYTLVATGMAVRDSSLNVSITFTGAGSVPTGVPDGDTSSVMLLIVALGLLGLVGLRRDRCSVFAISRVDAL